MGDRLYGCDDCLDACPPGHRLAERSTSTRGRHDLIEVLAASDRALLDRFSHFYIPQRRARYLRRNALVALGNTGGREVLGVAAGYLGHPDWLLRAHAAWAIGRLGHPGSGAVLAAARAVETHPEVVEEIDAARAAPGGRVP
jgi:epoxyqueuosine reductase